MVALWQCLGGPGSWPYRLFDAERRRLNHDLVQYLRLKTLRQDGCRAIEIGSGPGYASTLLARCPNITLSVALDRDFAALQEGRRQDPTLPVVRADLYALPFRSGSFDLVWNSSTLEHVPDMSQALAEMRRVAAPRGWLFVGVPYRGGLLGFQRWIAHTPLGQWIGTVFSRGALMQKIEEAGWHPVETRYYWIARTFLGVLARKA